MKDQIAAQKWIVGCIVCHCLCFNLMRQALVTLWLADVALISFSTLRLKMISSNISHERNVIFSLRSGIKISHKNHYGLKANENRRL